ncbi:uncharacterized protein LOC123553949 [Mercenaria mercenaria]|uniref:uncharacterized protein LOC123553949 n=1 Tax=Mercenaria mercenaria TaxID=6596 RepID=UPI00234E4134|nr:uncharacterized protein LOC123553949 [Mercenaria mercenaria]
MVTVGERCQDEQNDQGQRNVRGARGQKRPAADLEDAVDERLLQTEADVWVVGDSIPFWAGEHAKATGKPNLGIPNISIAWWAVRGLRWRGFRHAVETQVILSSPPSIIYINLGGNDLVYENTCELRRIIEIEINYLREAFPDTTIVWVDILQRQNWQGAFGGKKPIEKKRKRLNRIARKIVTESGRSDVISPDIDAETAFFRNDGVHLNLVGLEFYIDYLRDSIRKLI